MSAVASSAQTAVLRGAGPPAATAPAFIETQIPVSRLSKESYKERKANHGQTLTGLGKWWGRKPLVLVRATILGVLLPSTHDPEKDREVFLRLMTMDEAGLWRRKNKNIPLRTAFDLLTPEERVQYFDMLEFSGRPHLSREHAEAVQRLAFARLSYDEKLEYCARPEEIDGPSPESWAVINAHLGTAASALSELVQELGIRRWGRVPRVGDAFCGGGSVPFEAARLGCEAFGSDLNPVAALLTWAALNIVGGGEEVAQEVRAAQKEVFDAVDRQITEWDIEHNEQGWRADAFLYCVEAICPECGYRVPLAPSWVIGRGTKTIAVLERDDENRRFDISIRSRVSDAELAAADDAGTVFANALRCPNCPPEKSTPIAVLRGDRQGGNGTEYGLRLWVNDDVVPRADDVFQERLYCVRWVETYFDAEGKKRTRRHYRSVGKPDLEREKKVLELLRERFLEWQAKGYIPSRRIEPGEKTDEPIRTRGWTYWHHLFTPRQLLTLGSICNHSAQADRIVSAACMLGNSRCADYNSRLSRWHSHSANEKVEQVFSNQALNTLFNYGARALQPLKRLFLLDYPTARVSDGLARPADARSISASADMWLTDPPYADAINYHELAEFFLAWYEKQLQQHFPEWYTDTRRAIAVVGSDDSFRRSMVECYRNLTAHMPDDGMQVVMFTHQDAAVWADLALILWAAGLRVTAAWTIATETESALKAGNYVQGTVLLVLRKRGLPESAFLDEILPQVDAEVRRQLDDMLALDDKDQPNFGDTDYQLAAYAAALRVLTRYEIEDYDVLRELTRPRRQGEKSKIEGVIDHAVEIAANHLVPQGFDSHVWRSLTPEERFYLKGLDLESHGEFRAGAYQELARGLGVREYAEFLASERANQQRVKTASEWGTRALGGAGFAGSLVRNILFAVREAASDESAVSGRNWLHTERPNYWNERTTIVHVLRYLAERGQHLVSWNGDTQATRLLAGAIENHNV